MTFDSGNDMLTEVATFVYSEDGPGQYTVMMMRFTVDSNTPMSRVGYAGEEHLFGYYNGSRWELAHDPYSFGNMFTADDDDCMRELAGAVEMGDVTVERLQHVGELTPADVEEMVA